MQPRSLRVGTRLPNPGAVLKGCPRPTALRFDSPFSGAGRLSPFGDGTYSSNILQGGALLQPQDYLLNGVTPLQRCIVITGAATVAPDPITGAAAFMCHNLVLDGAAASLSASTNCKGLLGFVDGLVALRDGANLHMNKLGKAGAFGDLSPDLLLPASFASRVATKSLAAYVVKGRGAEGGATIAGSYTSNPGHAAGPMQTGGGGTGMTWGGGTSGKGGCGGPCCGGAASGGGNNVVSPPAGDFGGPGGPGSTGSSGGAGDPPGMPGETGYSYGEGPGGGLIALFAGALTVETGGIISTDGAAGGAANGCPGGGAGGGCIIVVTRPDGYTNHGTLRAAGGLSGAVYGSTNPSRAGTGGAGSVNIFELTD